MKPPSLLAAAPLACALLAGCQSPAEPGHGHEGSSYSPPKNVLGSTSSTELNAIRIGMTEDEVRSVLGPPDSTSAQAYAKYLVYHLELPTRVDTFTRDPPFLIRLVGGRVESFGRFAELFDLYSRPVTRATPGQPGFPQTAYSLGIAPPAVAGDRRPGPQVDLVSELEALKALRDQGVLTGEEFQRAKAKLLAAP